MNPTHLELVKIFEYLPEKDQSILFEFAQFLKSRAPEPASKITEPLGITRPDEESVVSAIKRLKQNFPMISQNEILHKTSELMMQHMMHGKSSKDVIDELEIVFEYHFKKSAGDTE